MMMSGQDKLRGVLTGAVISAAIISCSESTTGQNEACNGYLEWSSSPYVLPYAPSAQFTVIQGNCSPPGNGHRGVNRYAYDFGMPIGTSIAAMRAGTVVDVEESHQDGQIAATGLDNYLVIRHPDGSTSLYGHLTHDGALVAVGDVVVRGQEVARSGNTGNTAGIPHLHVSVQDCDPVTQGTAACPSRPLTFSNTDPNPEGLLNGVSYTAR